MISTMGFSVKIPQHIRDRAEKALADAWQDEDVKHFLKKNQDSITPEMKKVAESTILNFVAGKKSNLYSNELVLYNDHIYMHETPKETLGKVMSDKGINRSFKYDDVTNSLANIQNYDEGELGILKAESYIADFVANYRYGAGRKGTWLHGNRGVGKTYLMGYFAKLLKQNNVGFTFINSAQLHKNMIDVQKRFSKDVKKTIWSYKSAEVLMIDDMGSEKPTDFMVNDILFEIFDHRMNHNLPTFCTSNYTKHDYGQYILSKNNVDKMELNRYIERIDTLMGEILVTGRNRRDKA